MNVMIICIVQSRNNQFAWRRNTTAYKQFNDKEYISNNENSIQNVFSW